MLNSKKILLGILIVLFLPVILIRDSMKSTRSAGRKIGYILLTTGIFGTIWWNATGQIISSFTQTVYEVGITDKLTKIPVRGTSMLPTIKDGSEIELNNPSKFGLTRGDIVSFQNKETNGLHYLKRIVGLPNEEVVIKNGIVFINGKALQEDYTLNNLPTFGNTALTECDVNKIPEDHYMVLGDNRTVSSDSRVVGFVDRNDINGVMKTNIGEKFVTEQAQKEMIKAEINPEIFLKKLNEARITKNNTNLVTHVTLNNLAKKRSEQIAEKFADWKKQSVPADKMLEESGYRFNQIHEFVTFGYLDEQSVIDQIMELSSEKDQFFSNQYTEVGIGVTEKKNNECTFPVISVIISWPAVPTYDKAVIEGWAKEISTSNQSLPNLQSWIGIQEIDQVKLKKLISMVAQMQQIATRIYQKEKNSEWLTPKDYQEIKQYEDLVKEASALDAELFAKYKKVQGIKSFQENIRRY